MNYRNPKVWAIGIVIVLIIIFLLQNLEPVHITFLVWTGGLSRALLMIILLVVGGILGWFGRGLYRRFGRRR